MEKMKGTVLPIISAFIMTGIMFFITTTMYYLIEPFTLLLPMIYGMSYFIILLILFDAYKTKLRNSTLVFKVFLITLFYFSLFTVQINITINNLTTNQIFFIPIISVLLLTFLGYGYYYLLEKSFHEHKEEIKVEDIINHISNKMNGNKNQFKVKLQEILCSAVKDVNNYMHAQKIIHALRDKNNQEQLRKTMKAESDKTKFDQIFNEETFNFDLYQYFTNTDNLEKTIDGFQFEKANGDKSNKESLEFLLDKTLDMEKFYEGIIWTIGGIFITAAFTIIALSFQKESLNTIVGVLLGTGIYFIFYQIFLRFRMSLRLFRNASRVYESLLNYSVLKYVYDYEKKLYGTTLKIREILLTILFILIDVSIFVLVIEIVTQL